MSRWLRRWAVVALVPLSIVGCSDSGTEPKQTGGAGVSITPKELTLPVGGTGALAVAVRDARGNDVRGAQIFWSSADTAIAVVSPEGVVRAKKAGTVKIAASVGGSSDIATVIISPQSVASISLTPVTVTLTVGGSTQLTVTLAAANGEVLTRTVTWRGSNDAVVSVDANGRVTATGPGVASVTATSEGRSTSASITVAAVAIGGVSVSPTAVSLTVGQTTQLSAAVTDVNGQVVRDRDVRWTSSNEGVATVSSSGLAIGLAVGSATITASVDGRSASVGVTVSPIPVGAVVVSPSPAQLIVGQSVALSVQITDASGRIVDRAKAFASDAPGIATVDQQGLVRAVAPGTTTVRVSSEGQVGTTTIVVTRVPVASVTISPATANVMVGRTVTLAASVRDASGSALGDRPVSWRSGNEAVATVSQSGVVSGVRAGSAVIFATADGQSDQATVSVTPVPVGSVEVMPGSSAITVGQTVQLSATVRDADNRVVTDREVTWSTSDARIALVSASGLVTGVNSGTVTITAVSEGRAGTAVVTVAPVPVASVDVAPSGSTLQPGQTAQLTATPRDAAGNPLSGRTISWSSSDTQVATVSNTGLVTAVRVGSATITATSEERSGSASVNVTTVPVGSVVVSPSRTSLIVGATEQLTATVRDANGVTVTDRPVTWESSDASVARVSTTGLVTAVNEGSATITATSEGRSGTAAVTVTLPPVARVTVTPPSTSMTVGGSVELRAQTFDAAGNELTGRAISWTSNRPEVAAVDQNGVVRGLTTGTATITATSEDRTGSATVTVTAPPPPLVASVTISPENRRIKSGNGLTLSAACRDAAGVELTGVQIAWQMTATRGGVATFIVISPNQIRVLAGEQEGVATFTASCGGRTGSTTVTVEDD